MLLFDMARKEDADIMITLDGDGQHDPGIVVLMNTLKFIISYENRY